MPELLKQLANAEAQSILDAVSEGIDTAEQDELLGSLATKLVEFVRMLADIAQENAR